MIEDAELLRRYIRDHSEAAFAELVQRHLNFVYAAALRQVGGDAHCAQDVTQSVFADLARKAAALTQHRVLAGWLFTSTRFAAAKAVRAERRRQTREQEARTMDELTRDSLPVADWDQLRPVIDDALQTLNERDREAVLLRFFESRSFPEVGARLAVTDDAARLRVERALEKMRVVLAKSGVTSTTVALAVVLANQPVVAVPAAFAATVTTAALASAAAGGGTAAAAAFMSMTKLKIGILVAALAAGAASIVVQRQTNAQLQSEVGALRDQTRELARLRTENERLAHARLNDQAELAGLRAEITTKKNPPSDSARPLTTAPDTDLDTGGNRVLASGLKPAAAFVRADRSTPQATLETILSATNDGDTAALAKLFNLLPASRQKVEEMFAGLPEAKRAEYGSAQQMLALLLAGSTPVAGMQVMSVHAGPSGADFDSALAGDPSYQTLHVQRQYTDGRVREQDMVFQQTTDGWSWVPPTGLTSKMGEMLKPAPANQKHDGVLVLPKIKQDPAAAR